MNVSYVVIFFLLIAIGILNAYIAKGRQKNPLLWFLIGFSFGLLGLFLLVLWPATNNNKQKEKKKAPAFGFKKDHTPLYNATDLPGYPTEELHLHEPNHIRFPSDKKMSWYLINRVDEIVGPLTLRDLRKTLIENNLDENTYIWCEEFGNKWHQIRKITNNNLLDADFL